MIDLDAIRRLCEAATPGPWLFAAGPSPMTMRWPLVSTAEGRHIADLIYVMHTSIDRPVPGDHAFNKESRANGDFLAQARTFVPLLIAEVERQEARAEAAEAEVTRLTDQRRRLVEALERIASLVVPPPYPQPAAGDDLRDKAARTLRTLELARTVAREAVALQAVLASGDGLSAVRP